MSISSPRLSTVPGSPVLWGLLVGVYEFAGQPRRYTRTGQPAQTPLQHTCQRVESPATSRATCTRRQDFITDSINKYANAYPGFTETAPPDARGTRLSSPHCTPSTKRRRTPNDASSSTTPLSSRPKTRSQFTAAVTPPPPIQLPETHPGPGNLPPGREDIRLPKEEIKKY